MGKPPAPHMLEWHRELLTGESNEHLEGIAGSNTCLLSPRGPLDLDTLVATSAGWRPLRDVKKGSYVYASDGTLTRVKGVVRYGQVDCWDVELSDGTVVTCDDSHGWDVISTAPRRWWPDWERVPLQKIRTEIVVTEPAPAGDPRARVRVKRKAEPGEKPWVGKNGVNRWRVPTAEPVRRPTADLPIDPYLLGAILGKSTLVKRVWLTMRDPEVVERVRGSLPEGCLMRPVRASTEVYSIVGPRRESGQRRVLSTNPIIPPLEAMGLTNKAKTERRIPRAYLNASIAQRMALLQGILDASGRSRRGGAILYECTSRPLFEGVLELIRSLGGVANEVPTRPLSRRDSGRPRNRLFAHLPKQIEPFYCDVKSKAYTAHVQQRRTSSLYRTIADIRPAGRREVGCIEVEHVLHDFLIKDYVVSCNSAKSTEVGLLCAWLIGNHTLARKLLRILYVSFIVDVARGKSQAIKNTILSADYQEIFPMVRISKNQTSNELWSIDFKFAGIDVRGEDAFTLACAGLRGAITSKRSNLVVLDDLIKSRKSITNPEVRREMEGNWKQVIVPTMFQGARAIALGTRFHWDDILATTFNEKNGWKVLVQGALVYDDDGKSRSYWPEMWSLKYLLDLQQKDPVAFAYQYMNRAVRSEELGLSYELFVREEVPDSFDEIGVGIDLSSGMSEKNDYTVFMLGGRDGDKAYIIDMRRMRCMGNIEKVEALCDLLHDWNLIGKDENGKYFPTASEVSIWPEDVAYQKSFQGDFRRKAFDEWGLINLRVSPDKRGGTKGDILARFRGVIGLFETRKVIFNRYRDFQVVFDEIANLGNAPHDDCVSAIEILLKRLFGRGQVQIDWRDWDGPMSQISSEQFERIAEAARERKSAEGVDTMIVLSHLAQMRLFMLRQGIEFFPRQDTYGFRNVFLARIVEENEVDARLDGIIDDFCLDGNGLWFFRPVRETYRIMWFRKGMYQAYYDAMEDLEELDLIYSFKARSQIGASVGGIQEGGNKIKWVRLRVRRDEIIEMITDEKPSFDAPMEQAQSLGRQKRTTINSLGFIPAIEAFNIMRSTGMEATGDFASVAHHVLVHDALSRNIRENIRFFGNPTLVSSRPRQDLLESDEAQLRRPTIASQSGFSSAGRPSTRHSLTGSPSLADGLRIPRLITNLDNTDRVQYITPNAVSGDQNLYARQYREEIRTLLGGVDELGISSGATAYEIRSLYGRAATTAARKCQGLLSYGLCKLLALMIYHEERIFQESFARAVGMLPPEAPIRENFVGETAQADFDTAAQLYQQDYANYRAQVDAAIDQAVEAQDFPPGVVGLVPDGDRRVEWRWKGPVFEESTEDILNNSIVVRNLQELGVNSVEALRHLFPNKTAEERSAMLNGYPFRMVEATQRSIGTFLSLVGQMQSIPHPQAPNLPLLADAELDMTPFLYRALNFLKRELTYAGQYGDATGSADPAELSPIDRARADAGLPGSASGGITFLPDAAGSGGPLAGGVSAPVRQFERDADIPTPGAVLANDPTSGRFPSSLPLASSRLPAGVRFGDADLAAPSNAGVFADLSARFAQPAPPVEPAPAPAPAPRAKRGRRVSKRRK